MPDANTPVPELDPERVETVLCDLDGVLWLAHEPVPGAAEAVEALREGGRRVVFVTNNSVDPVSDQVRALAAIDVAAEGDVVTSAMAAASLVRRGERVLVVGGHGIVEAVDHAGAIALTARDAGVPPDAVIVGLDRGVDYPRLSAAATAIRSGARFIATNTDATFPTPTGPAPGGGAIVAAVATAAGVEPTVAGKPHAAMAQLIGDVVGGASGFDPATVVMVGDRPETDGLFAGVLGCAFALVRSGVTRPGAALPDDVAIAVDVADLAALAEHLAPRAPAPK